MRSWFARLTLSAGAWSLSPWGWLTLVAVALCGVLLSVGASRSTRAAEHEAERVRFERRVHDITGELQLHLDETARLLRSTAALFGASHDVSLDDWRRFGQAQRLDDAFPGLLGLGEAPLVNAAQRPALEAAMRRGGLPGYTVRPAGERAFYAPVQFREPLDANRVALGFDLLSSPRRRDTLERARDSGEPALSTDLTLMRADRQGHRGAILALAVYRGGLPLATVAQRRAALTGWVFAPIDLQVLMQQLVHGRADELHVELCEGGQASVPIIVAGPPVAGRSPLQAQRDLRLADRTWSLRLIEPAGAEGTDGDRSWPVLAAGLAITLLMMLLVAALLNMRGRAMALARRMSAAYRDSEARVRAVLDHAAEGILTVDDQGRILSANPVARRLLGLPAGSFDEQRLSARLQMDLAALMQQVDASPHGHWRGEIVQGASTDDGVGGPLTLLLAASAAQLDEGSHCYVLMLSDVTELRRERERADEAGRLNETILANAPFSVIATDKRGLIRSVNPAGERLLGYEAGELLGRNVLHTVMRTDELVALAERTARELGQPVDAMRVIGVRTLRGAREELEVSYRRKDGSDLPVMLALAPLRDRAGELTGFLGIAYDVTERKRSEAYIRHMAHHDELTGLPNRTLLQERTAAAIDAARAGGHHLAVLLIDLDRFKQINDSLGHHAGDVVLCSVAARLKHCLRSTDMVARMGGDEFVILLPQLDTPQQAERVAAKLLQAMVEPVQAGPHRLSVTPSIGIACFPRDGDDLTTLLRNADAAMYQSKGQGRNGYTLYTPQMHAASAQRLELEGELREALERGQLSLHYQPLVSLADGGVVGVEALLRWAHPERGNISPVDFIPIAEDTGLIVPIGEWVLRTACSDMRRLQQLTGRRLKVAVNLSPRQLRMPDVATMIADALRAADWPADALELEITESMVVENPDASIAVMQRLRAMGVGMAIDDFGTGYSSLSYLTRFPVAKLKLDRSFVRGLPHSERDAAIATSVVAMGHGLKLQVLAEGVETDAQMRFLRELGCEMGQGWLFAKAMPFDALMQHLAQADAPQQAIA